MRLEKVQEALKTKKIHYEYTEENGCGKMCIRDRDFTDRIIRDFPDIRCGILRLTQVQDMQWDFFPAVSYTHLQDAAFFVFLSTQHKLYLF